MRRQLRNRESPDGDLSHSAPLKGNLFSAGYRGVQGEVLAEGVHGVSRSGSRGGNAAG
jgi:hypothetical protein